MATADQRLYFLTIHQAGELMRRGELSPVELTRACLDRIADTDDRLHSFILLLADEALEQARVAESEMLRGEYRGPMHGIPFALKDLYDTAGVRTTSGSRVDIERIPTEDATTTARLKDAGGILLGKLAMHEFALGGPDWTTPFEPACNPWNLNHITGGSSSGSGSAVAAGQALGALGFLHRRLDPGPGVPLWHRWLEADLRPSESLRCGDPELVPGPRRPDDVDRRGHRVHAAGHRGPRPQGSHFEPGARARLLTVAPGEHPRRPVGDAPSLLFRS